jgi:hypothetical protein
MQVTWNSSKGIGCHFEDFICNVRRLRTCQTEIESSLHSSVSAQHLTRVKYPTQTTIYLRIVLFSFNADLQLPYRNHLQLPYRNQCNMLLDRLN